MRKLSAGLCFASMVAGAFTLAVAGDAPAQQNESFRLTSSSFDEGQEIPKLYTCDDKNASPPLAWTEPPAGTKTFAVMLNDPDAPSAEKTGNPFVHWILINIPADTHSLVEGIRRLHIPAGAKEGTNDMKREGYDGPCPPAGAKHRYVFTLYAVDAPLNGLERFPTWAEVEPALNGHVLAKASLVGTYERPR